MSLRPGEQAELHRQGAKAAARGDAPATNPMLYHVNQPGRTGESQQLWACRFDAWRQGYELQRPGRGAPPSARTDEVTIG